MINHTRHRLTPLLIAGSLVVGCGDTGPQLANATGVVTQNGQPLDRVGVVFHPAVGPIATANTNERGEFTVRTANREGALIGEHVVTINEAPSRSFKATEDGLVGAATGAPRAKWRFAPAYSRSNTSPLRATVAKGEDNTFQFELSPGGAAL